MAEPDHYGYTEEEVKEMKKDRKILEATIQRMVNPRMEELLDTVLKSTIGNNGDKAIVESVKQKLRRAVEDFFDNQEVFRTR